MDASPGLLLLAWACLLLPYAIVSAERSALMSACHAGDLSKAKSLLLEARLVDEKTGQGPLHVLALSDSRSISKNADEWVETLTGAGCDVDLRDNDGYSPLVWAAQNNKIELAHSLIKLGADTNARSKLEHISPLLAATQNGHAEMIRILLSSGAAPNQVSKRGISALIAATSRGDQAAECVRILVDGGVDGELSTSELGITALHVAAQEGFFKLSELLVRRAKVDLNRVNKAGISPLMLASAKGHYSIVKLLLDEGADVDYKVEWDFGDDEKEEETWDDGDIVKQVSFISALSMAQSYEHSDVADLLERYLDL